MNILAIDTTTKTACVSIKNNDNIYMDKIENEVTHSEKLLPLIDKVLTDSNMKLSDINMLACINGPGSFTGIRIGLATIKALAQVNSLNIFSINSLELIAYCNVINNKKDNLKYVTSIISTNNDRVFYCIYEIEKVNKKIILKDITGIKNEYIDEAVVQIKEFITENNIQLNCIDICGNCINIFENEFSILNCSKYNFYPDTNDCIQTIDYIYDTSKYIFNAYSLKATYARPSQAERMKNEKN